MNITSMAHAMRVADQEARHSGFTSAEEKQRAIDWLERHKGREKLLVGIAGLLRRLDTLPRGR